MPTTNPSIAHPEAVAPPALCIIIGIETTPRVFVDAMNDGEEARLLDWLEAAGGIRELVEKALALDRRAA